MSPLKKWSLRIAAALVLVPAVAALLVVVTAEYRLHQRSTGAPEPMVEPSAALREDAPRQLRILGCFSCHGESLQGDKLFDEPGVARLYAPNLALLAREVSDATLARAIRQGIGSDGRALFGMPSAAFSRLSDEAVAALVAALREVPAGGEVQPSMSVGFLGRVGLVTGRFKPQTELIADFRAREPVDLGPAFARGRDIARIRCAECHGPDLGGGEPKPGVVAPDLRIVAAYDATAFAKLMKRGVAIGDRELDLMGRVARADLSALNDEEIAAIHEYLARRAAQLPG
jgi:mono/diheme cytochrome c family protein